MRAIKNLKKKSHFESPRISFWNTRNGIVNDRIWRTERWSVDFWNDTVGNGKTGYDFEKNEIEKRDYHKISRIQRTSLVSWFYTTRYIKMILLNQQYWKFINCEQYHFDKSLFKNLCHIISVWEFSISAFLSLMATHRYQKKWIFPPPEVTESDVTIRVVYNI